MVIHVYNLKQQEAKLVMPTLVIIFTPSEREQTLFHSNPFLILCSVVVF